MERENPTIALFQFFALFLFRFLCYMKLVYSYDLLKIITNNKSYIHYKYNLSTCMSHHFKLK